MLPKVELVDLRQEPPEPGEQGRTLFSAQLKEAISETLEADRTTIAAGGHEYAEIEAPARFWGRPVGELALRERHGVHLLAIQKHEPRVTADGRSTYERTLVADPDEQHVVEEGDLLAVVGTADRLSKVAGL